MTASPKLDIAVARQLKQIEHHISQFISQLVRSAAVFVPLKMLKHLGRFQTSEIARLRWVCCFGESSASQPLLSTKSCMASVSVSRSTLRLQQVGVRFERVNDCQNRANDDDDIQPEGPVFDIEAVGFGALRDGCIAAQAVDLRPTGPCRISRDAAPYNRGFGAGIAGRTSGALAADRRGSYAQQAR